MAYRSWVWFPRQPTMAEKRRRALVAARKLGRGAKARGKLGRASEPVILDRHQIAVTFWGKAWCQNLESYSDFANRLPRGRSYLRAGAVVDLEIAEGEVRARVAGRRLYEVAVTIKGMARAAWRRIVGACTGRIDSMLALLEGRIPERVMRSVTDSDGGLFPRPREIAMTCSCPDWAGMCKHVAAALYAVGTRLDDRPELLFRLRGVDPTNLVHDAAGALAEDGGTGPAARKRGDLAAVDLGEMFGIELARPAPAPRASKAEGRARRRRRAAPVHPPADSNRPATTTARKRGTRQRRGGARPTSPSRSSRTPFGDLVEELTAIIERRLRRSRLGGG